MAENISAFAAYNSSNEISASTVNGMRKNKSNKTGRTPIKLTINKKKMAASKSNKWKKNKKQIAVNLNEAIENGLVQTTNSIPSTSNKAPKKATQKANNKNKRVAQQKAQPKNTLRRNTAPQERDTTQAEEPRSSIGLNGTGNPQHEQNQSAANNTTLHNQTIDMLREEGSIYLAKRTFAWLVEPISVDDFMANHWENSLYYVTRISKDKYKKLLSTEGIDAMLRKKNIEFTKNIDLTSYRDGVRETHNQEGRAMPYAVWESYRSGCSIRILNPQTFIPAIHQLNATLQEYFQCMTGANVYLTPPNSQGFAPHYDDIEAFVLQVEGKKLWKLYSPRTEDERLSRESSGNLNADEIGEPIFEKILEPGDLLYFPRGTIHQAHTVPGHHSLHITLSVYQKMSFGDLMEQLVPLTLQNAINSDIEFRRGLPVNIWNCMGFVHSDSESDERNRIKLQLKQLFSKLLDYIDLDGAVDQMALKYQHDALPPYLSTQELVRTSWGTKSKVTNNGKIRENKLKMDTKFRLLRANIIRLVPYVDDVYRLYYYVDNSKEYHEYELNYTELDNEAAMVVEHIIKLYPQYVDITKLNNELLNEISLEQQIEVVQELWNRGFLMTKEPIN